MITREPNPSVSHNAKDLVGTWTLVSVVTERDGSKSDTYGRNAKGLLLFDEKGRYSIIFIAANLPKFVSGNRSNGTADEKQSGYSRQPSSFRHVRCRRGGQELHVSGRPRHISKLGGQEH